MKTEEDVVHLLTTDADRLNDSCPHRIQIQHIVVEWRQNSQERSAENFGRSSVRIRKNAASGAGRVVREHGYKQHIVHTDGRHAAQRILHQRLGISHANSDQEIIAQLMLQGLRQVLRVVEQRGASHRIPNPLVVLRRALRPRRQQDLKQNVLEEGRLDVDDSIVGQETAEVRADILHRCRCRGANVQQQDACPPVSEAGRDHELFGRDTHRKVVISAPSWGSAVSVAAGG
mmetsp:Transcript_95278/g.308585  ORF Transcript_95278/g.308585 Transcript_95278/m.308585 type:complete len:231 (+) Transcript_95278:778-1470(+)